jgi:Leucine-rich repeat (LRR) protein
MPQIRDRFSGSGGTGISSIPEWLGGLKKLENLSFKDLKITTLPASLGKLENLTRINLEGTGVKKLPTSLAERVQKSILYMWSTRMTREFVMMPEFDRQWLMWTLPSMWRFFS